MSSSDGSSFDKDTRDIMNADIQKMGGLQIGEKGIESEIESSPRPSIYRRADFLREQMLENIRENVRRKAAEERKRAAESEEPLLRHRKHSRMSLDASTDPSGAGTSEGPSASVSQPHQHPEDVDMETTFRSPKNMQEVMAQAISHARKEKRFQQGRFEFVARGGHILESSCKHADGVECMRCKYTSSLTLAELPEMVFPRNTLTIHFLDSPAVVQFNCLDALKLVSEELPDVKVGASTAWQSTRKDRIQQITEQHKPFDWTYTTHYKGTLEGCRVEPTDERIDLERLKRRDQIMFLDNVTLFEDELADHGIAQLTARIRVMDAGYFFVLLRFYMRVDNVLIRVCDTRIVGNDSERHVLREWQLREAKYENLGHVDPEELLNPDYAWQHLPVVREEVDKIIVDE